MAITDEINQMIDFSQFLGAQSLADPKIACISQTSIIYTHMHTHTEVQQFTVEENHLQALVNILKLVSNKP